MRINPATRLFDRFRLAPKSNPQAATLAAELDEIRRQQTLLLTMLDHTQAGVVVHGNDGSVRYINASARKILGLNAEMLPELSKPGWHWWLFDEYGSRLTPEQFPARRVLQTGEALDHLLLAIQPFDAGALRWCDVKAAPVLDLDGEISQVVVTLIDVTAQRRAREALAASESLLRNILDQAPVGICITDASGTLQAINPAYCQLFEYSAAELIGQPMSMVSPLPYRGVMNELYRRFIDSGMEFRGEWEVVTKSGRPRTVLATSARISTLHPPQAVTFVIDISDKKDLENDLIQKANLLEKRAREDGLTGLFNRQASFEMLDYALERCKRYQETLSVLMLDVDFFKQINDTYGHMTGDKVLTAVAAAIKQSIRTVDIAGRYGGEEFIVILPNIDIEGAAIVAERLRQAILEIRIEGNEIEASASFGVSSYAENDDTEFLVNRADLALYKSKRNGRNRVTVG